MMRFNQLSSLKKFLDTWAPVRMQYCNVPGVALGMLGESGDFLELKYGTLSTEKLNKFHVGSVSKFIAAIAVLQLHEKNLLDIDNYVISYIQSSNFKWLDQDVTIKQLLAHRAGLARDGVCHEWPSREISNNLLSEVKNAQIFPPDKAFKYSNLGYAVLGEVVETVSGCSYEEYVKENIFSPAGMTSSHTDTSYCVSDIKAGFSTPLSNLQLNKLSLPLSSGVFSPAFGAVSTLEDCVSLLKFLTRNKLINNKSIDLMRSPLSNYEDGEGYGLGCELDSNVHGYGHGGQILGYSVDLFCTKHGTSIATFADTYTDIVWQIREVAADFVLNGMPDEFPTDDSISGYYRSETSEIIILAGVGGDLYVYDPSQVNPCNSHTRLANEGIGEYRNTETEGFGYAGELVKITFDEKGYADTIRTNDQKWKRVHG